MFKKSVHSLFGGSVWDCFGNESGSIQPVFSISSLISSKMKRLFRLRLQPHMRWFVIVGETIPKTIPKIMTNLTGE